MKRLVFLFLLSLALTYPTDTFSQLIESFSWEISMGAAKIDYQKIDSPIPDFMNYMDCYQYSLVDDANWTINMQFGLKNNWEIAFDLERHLDLTPLLFDLKTTKRVKDNWSISMGLQTESFKLQSIDDYFTDTHQNFSFESNYYSGTTLYYIDSYLGGPYVGINFYKQKNRFSLRYTLNTGVAINKKTNRYIRFKEIESNYVFANAYDLNRSLNVWLKPEFYVSYILFNFEKSTMGLRIEADNYITRKGINYDVTHFEWTAESATTQHEKLPKHWVNYFSIDFGLFFGF